MLKWIFIFNAFFNIEGISKLILTAIEAVIYSLL